MKQAIAYYRVSTELQKEEGTIEIQRSKIADFVAKQGYELIAEFSDNGVSGGLRDRPGLKQLLDQLQDTTAECVIIYKLDRLARDLYIQEGLIQEINKQGKQLVSTLEPDLDSNDPFRKAFRQMLGVFAEFEKAMIALRLEGGRERKAQQGGWHGGNIYGYRHDNGTLKVNLIEAEAVRMIYSLRRKHMTYANIARSLSGTGFKTKRRTTQWRASTIRKILKNPIYKTGKIRYKGNTYESTIERIIT